VVVAEGIGSTATVGTPKTVATVTVDGIAAGGGVGQPSAVMLMRPNGIASTAAVGDPSTVATVLAVSIAPFNLFGDARATKKGFIFRPPANTYQWRLFKEYEGISLLKENGTWSEVAHPDLERTLAAQKYLGGGRDHVVSTSLKTELEGLGYTVTEEVVTTEDYLS